MTGLRYLAGMLSLAMACSFAQAASPKAINEEMFVPIGGIEQWITIKGSNSANPVVLFLHGGPGDAMSPYADSLFAGWDTDFTMVQWDQRGAGRTYGKTGPAIEPTMTMERMTQDGIEVAEYLSRHLHKRKIILNGLSWGSILGIQMAHARPDLFYAYVGDAQMVGWWQDVSAAYVRVLQLAEQANDQTTVAALKSLGPPPWKTVSPQWQIYRKAEQAYQAKIVTAPAPPVRISPAYAGAAERKQYAEADDFSQLHFFAARMPKIKADFASLPFGPIASIDLTALGTDFQIPIYIVQGGADLTTVPEVTKAYFDSIKAPRKGFYLVPGAGHEPSKPMLELTHKILLEQVKPLAE